MTTTTKLVRKPLSAVNNGFNNRENNLLFLNVMGIIFPWRCVVVKIPYSKSLMRPMLHLNILFECFSIKFSCCSKLDYRHINIRKNPSFIISKNQLPYLYVMCIDHIQYSNIWQMIDNSFIALRRSILAFIVIRNLYFIMINQNNGKS